LHLHPWHSRKQVCLASLHVPLTCFTVSFSRFWNKRSFDFKRLHINFSNIQKYVDALEQSFTTWTMLLHRKPHFMYHVFRMKFIDIRIPVDPCA
jgi:hypothetical protein